MEWVLRRRGLLLGFSLGCSAATANAAGFALGVRPEIGLQTGIETFELSASIPSTQAGVNIVASSKLSYPVSMALAGGTLFADFGRASLSASALTNLVSPWGTLLDQDFLDASDGFQSQHIEFSHTDSRTTLRALVLEGAARFTLTELSPKPGDGDLYGVVGFRYESSSYQGYGATGWQLDQNLNQVAVSLPGDPLAIRYDVRYHVPFIGAGVDLAAGRPLSLRAEARLLGSWSSHDDDHVLRHKRAHALAPGAGFALAAEPALNFGRTQLGLSGQFQYLGALSGTLKQHYYADDPGLPGDQTGVAIPDSSFSFVSLRLRLMAFVAVRF